MSPRLPNEQMLTGSIVGHPVGSAHSLLVHCCNWECKGHSFPIATVDGQNPALRVRSLPSLVIIIIIIIIIININININITNNTVRYIDPCKSCHCFVARKHTILVNWSRRWLGVSPENVLANRNSAVSRLRACPMDYKNIIATFLWPKLVKCQRLKLHSDVVSHDAFQVWKSRPQLISIGHTHAHMQLCWEK